MKNKAAPNLEDEQTMAAEPRITGIELTSFTIRVPNVGTDRSGAGVRFAPGPGDDQLRFAVRVMTDAGAVGEYV